MIDQVYIDISNALHARERAEITEGIARRSPSWRGAKVSEVLCAIDDMGGYDYLLAAFERMFGEFDLLNKAPTGSHYRVAVAAAALVEGGYFADREKLPTPEGLYAKVEEIINAL